MISKHPVHENVIKRSINDMRYEIKSLVKLLDNEPSSDVNRRFYLRCTHDVVDSLQVVLAKFVSETDIDFLEDIEHDLP
ncbi:MAG: hypothetical protein RR851_15910 [Clostridium sp.]